jgi:hypothetical protein
MSPLNIYVEKSKFKLEGWEEMLDFSVNANYAIKFDIKKFYHGLSIHQSNRKYFGFMYQLEKGGEPEMFVWKTMPYGYTRAPYLARNLMKPLVAKWRSIGLNIVVFYDDGMAVHSDFDKLEQLATVVHVDLIKAGLIPGINKCIWSPVPIVDWNGLRFDLMRKKLAIMEHRITATLQTAVELKNTWPEVTFRGVAKLVGQINSMHPVLQGTEQLKTRNLQTIVNIRNYKNLSWDDRITADFDVIFNVAYNEINFWLDNLVRLNTRQFTPKVPQIVAWVDASDYAIAGIAAKISDVKAVPVTADNWLLDPELAYRRVSNCAQLQVADLPWSTRNNIITRDKFDLDPITVDKMVYCHRNLKYYERVTDSNERELLAAVELIDNCSDYFKNSIVTLHFDNLNASIICQKGSGKIRLQKYSEKLFSITTTNNIELRPVWIPRDLNNLADMLSKTIDYEDYAIADWFFKSLCKEMGVEPDIDCFANSENKKTEKFFSLSYCKNTSGVDCFNYNWRNYGICWLFPPPRLVGKVLNYVKACKANAILLVPQWKNAYFYTILKEFEKYTVKKAVYNGENVFVEGVDAGSHFGKNYRGNVEVYHLNCSDCA